MRRLHAHPPPPRDIVAEVEAEFAAREARLRRLIAMIAELERRGRHADARRARELLALATESIALARMSWRRRGLR